MKNTKTITMKKLFLLLVITANYSYGLNHHSVKNYDIEFFNFNISFMTEFENGFTDGFCNGFRKVKGKSAICPETPTPPPPAFEKNNYESGYDLGYSDGIKYARKI